MPDLRNIPEERRLLAKISFIVCRILNQINALKDNNFNEPQYTSVNSFTFGLPATKQ